MNRFSWYDATTVEAALTQVNATVSQTIQPDVPVNPAVFKSSGIDLLDLMKEGLAKPQKIINIKNITGLDQIGFDEKKGLRIGANVTLSQIASDDRMATLGGNLAQRTRCWYFRSIDHLCLRKGGGTCFARNGENEYHAIFENDFCVSVHASSVATALMAFSAKVEVTGIKGHKREIPMDSFFVLPEEELGRETILESKELITAVSIPPVTTDTRSYYINQGARESHDWPLADTAAVIEFSGDTCRNAVIVLGAAAPVPLKSVSAAQALIGKTINEEGAAVAAEAAMKGASLLTQNGYKIPLFKAIIKRAIMKCLNA